MTENITKKHGADAQISYFKNIGSYNRRILDNSKYCHTKFHDHETHPALHYKHIHIIFRWMR